MPLPEIVQSRASSTTQLLGRYGSLAAGLSLLIYLSSYPTAAGGALQKPPRPVVSQPITEGSKEIQGTVSPATDGTAAKITVAVDGTAVDKEKITQNNTTGEFTATLDKPLQQGQKITVIQEIAGQTSDATEVTVQAPPIYDWGRVRAYLTGGVLFSKERDEFSQQDLYLGFSLDKTWRWNATDQSFCKRIGINTFFEARLTAIPAAAQSNADQGSSTPEQGQGGTGQSQTPTNEAQRFLASRKAALLQGGLYFPILTTEWTFDNAEHSLFIAPLAKVGVQTITGTTRTAEATLFGEDDVFNFFAFGFRLGHYKLSGTPNAAHEPISYLDVTWGRFENLEIVQKLPKKNASDPEEILRKRPRRLGLEGRLKVPGTPIRVGFDANLGDGRDDLRFLLGTSFDIGNLFGRLRSLTQ